MYILSHVYIYRLHIYILYYIILYYIILYHIILYYIISYHIILYYIILYYIILYYIILYYIYIYVHTCVYMCISSHVFIIDMYGIAGCFQVLLCRIQNVSDYQGRGERRVLDAVRISLEEIPEIVIFMGKIWEHMGNWWFVNAKG